MLGRVTSIVYFRHITWGNSEPETVLSAVYSKNNYVVQYHIIVHPCTILFLLSKFELKLYLWLLKSVHSASDNNTPDSLTTSQAFSPPPPTPPDRQELVVPHHNATRPTGDRYTTDYVKAYDRPAMPYNITALGLYSLVAEEIYCTTNTINSATS